MLLRVIEKRTAFPGASAQIDRDLDYPLIDGAAAHELNYCLQYLANERLVEQEKAIGKTKFTLSYYAGWERLAPAAGGQPGSCFVAMSFDKSMDDAYEDGFATAISDCDLTAHRVDRVEHNDDINDRILAGIRQAQVVVADFTMQRHGVYFEAGFALGLGRTVIWTCRKNDIVNCHFDTQGFNHVVWTDVADLRQRLIGDRPRRQITKLAQELVLFGASGRIF